MFESQQLQHFGTAYSEIKFWLPLITIITVFYKAKTAVSGWADTLLNNHLHGIEQATVSTVTETKETNVLLRDSSGKLDMIQNTLADHQAKNLQVWQGVVESLTILKERSHPARRVTSRRKGRNG
jgi:hypothetical protein